MWQKIAAQAAMAAATTASIEAVRLAPAVTKAAKKFYERVRDRKRKREQGRALLRCSAGIERLCNHSPIDQARGARGCAGNR